MNRRLSVVGSVVLIFIPLAASAQQGTGTSFRGLVEQGIGFIDTAVIPLLFALAFIAILFGTLRYFFFEGEENLQKGRQFLLWGGISFVLMFIVWGVVRLLVGALGV